MQPLVPGRLITPPKRKRVKAKAPKVGRGKFIAAWLRSPLKMGALVPSSRALAKAMASKVDSERPGLVIELGAGTGVVTHALVQAGIKPKDLLVIEREPTLYKLLEAHFPHLNIVCGDAAHIDRILDKMGNPPVNAIVSSLPMLSLPISVKTAIQKQMAMLVGEKGVIVQFTYGAKSPLNRNELRKYHITGRRVKTVLNNVPPAHVWVYKHHK